MLGNDIVDLADLETQPGAQHPRFDARILNSEEMEFLSRHANPHRVRWTFWAAKEAAYKWLRKQDESVIFSPSSLSVSFLDDALESGGVEVGHTRLHVEWCQRADFVHALVFDETTRQSSAPRLVHVERMGNEEVPAERASLRLRELVIAHFAEEFETDASHLRIVREGKIPRLEKKGTMLEVDLSFSHHGRYAAFAAQPELHRISERGVA